MSRIGIDVGSTNTCAAIDDGRLRMIEFNEGGAVSMPTVICVAEGSAYVGREAVEIGRRFPDFDFRNFKRRLGEKWHPDEDTGYQTCEGTDDETRAKNGLLHFQGPDGSDYSPTELYSYALAECVKAANSFLAPDDEVTGVVLCVPARFEPHQVEAVKLAAKMAGIEDVTTIEEPIAAAIAHGLDVRKPRRDFIVDLGGGTLDCSATVAGEGRIRVIGKNGIADLGGVDWDKCIAKYVINLWRTETGSDLATRDAAMVRIMIEAEAVKKRLTDQEETEFRLEDIEITPGGVSQHMIYPIDRRLFDELTRDLRDRIIRACQLTLADIRKDDPNFSIKDIHEVLLVGGMTRVPSVRAAIAEFFGRQPRKNESPETVVAMGAAIKAAILDGRRQDIFIADITSHNIAIETTNNMPAIVVPRGTPYPLKKPLPVRIGNADEEQTEISVRLLYATRPRAEDCTVLYAEDIPVEPSPPGYKFTMFLDIDKRGVPSLSRAT
jgi:molecular chaperone DnaK